MREDSQAKRVTWREEKAEWEGGKGQGWGSKGAIEGSRSLLPWINLELHCKGCKRGVWLLSATEAYILSSLWRRKEEGWGAHTLPRYWPPAVPAPLLPPPPAPLPGDEWWYLLKVKPAGELWLRLRGRGRLLQKITGTNWAKRLPFSRPRTTSIWRQVCWCKTTGTGDKKERVSCAQS